jgi:hypothetical protein
LIRELLPRSRPPARPSSRSRGNDRGMAFGFVAPRRE